jgi:hypothetical protein
MERMYGVCCISVGGQTPDTVVASVLDESSEEFKIRWHGLSACDDSVHFPTVLVYVCGDIFSSTLIFRLVSLSVRDSSNPI